MAVTLWAALLGGQLKTLAGAFSAAGVAWLEIGGTHAKFTETHLAHSGAHSEYLRRDGRAESPDIPNVGPAAPFRTVPGSRLEQWESEVSCNRRVIGE